MPNDPCNKAQPDWWEVRQAGVGTNRYSYSFNDPVNLSDTNGHAATDFYKKYTPTGILQNEIGFLIGVAILNNFYGKNHSYIGNLTGAWPNDGLEHGPNILMDKELETDGDFPHIGTEAEEHILGGDERGGGHRAGAGVSGATEFPEDWEDSDILGGIEEVYGNGEEFDADNPEYFGIRGISKGIEIEIIVDGDGNVVTGYPTPGQPGVVENPE